MDNRHMNSNNSPPHSISDLGDRVALLSVSDTALGTSATTAVQINSSINENYSNMHSRGNPIVNPSRRLNPSAQEFVPRSMLNSPNASYPTNHLGPNNSQQTSTNNHSLPNGNTNNIQSASLLDGENDIEDYVALSYLKEFIASISNKPSIYDMGISEITCIVNSYLDEDECVLELIVNQIVDQSIVDVNFRYNGVRICFHFMEHMRQTSTGQTFKNILFKRCQRECSRKVSQNTSVNTFNHLRGLALFVADLFSRSKEEQLADNLPNLLMNILSSRFNIEENLKCVCQVLKLCGQQLDAHFTDQNKDDVKNVLKKLAEVPDCDISVYIRDMVKNIIKLGGNGWNELPRAPSNIINPYRNICETESGPVNAGNCDTYNQSYTLQDMYDFGGDEFDEEVCQDFEKFLKNLPSENS